MPGRASLPMVVTVALMTSAVVLAVAWLRGGVSVRRLVHAAGVTLETIGAVAIFMAANVALGMTLILALRAFTRFYPTLYEMTDISLLALSLVQALVYQSWRLTR